jgi:hypothetical protein
VVGILWINSPVQVPAGKSAPGADTVLVNAFLAAASAK